MLNCFNTIHAASAETCCLICATREEKFKYPLQLQLLYLCRILCIIDVNFPNASPAREWNLFLSGWRHRRSLWISCLSTAGGRPAFSIKAGRSVKNYRRASSEVAMMRSVTSNCNSRSVAFLLETTNLWNKRSLILVYTGSGCNCNYWACSSSKRCELSYSCLNLLSSSNYCRLFSTRNVSLHYLHQFLAFLECMPICQVWAWAHVRISWI